MCLCENKIEVKIYNKSANDLPVYAHSGDSGVDIRANEDMFIEVGKSELIKTGIHVDIPEGYEIQARSRSGLALKESVFVLNSPGTIDCGYYGEIGIILMNLDSRTHMDSNLNMGFQVKKGDRIAQLVLQKVPKIVWKEVSSQEELGESSRGSVGFGSSGVK